MMFTQTILASVLLSLAPYNCCADSNGNYFGWEYEICPPGTIAVPVHYCRGYYN